jgi:NAD(P)-dependent dehydrogenase (short-subunit alcohol dehydrogenase family)
MDFRGRRILITGGSRGIGREIAGLLAELGAGVIVAARSREDVERCVAKLRDHDDARERAPGDGGAHERGRGERPPEGGEQPPEREGRPAGTGEHKALAIDVADERAWREAGESGVLDGVDGLVTAAAALAPVGPIDAYSASEFWQTMRVNVLGTLLAVKACLGSLKASGGAVVTFAGGGATSPLPRYDAYAASKAAVVRLSENLGQELRGRSVRVNCVSPGFVATGIHAATLQAGPERAGEAYFADTERRLDAGGDPAREAAELTAFLLSGAAEGIAGRLISARWDPWREPAFRQRLREDPALATLRRIDDQLFTGVQTSE